jgi:maleate isomerase
MSTSVDSLWGVKFGLLTPATNLTVEDEYWSMRVDGATLATARIVIDQVDWRAPEDLAKFVAGVEKRIPDAIAHVQQAKPDALVLGISISVLWGGVRGNEALKARVKAATGLPLFTAVDALIAGLGTLSAKRIAVVTPYPQLADQAVRDFFGEIGVEVLTQTSLRAQSASAIGEIPPAQLRQAVKDANVPGAQAIVTLGTDLKISRIAAVAEDWLGLPTLAVNSATWWLALRGMGVRTRLDGWGSLLRYH